MNIQLQCCCTSCFLYCRHQSEEGWVPASYLCKLNNNDPVGEVEIIGKLSNISKLIQTEDGISLNDGHTAEVISGGPKQGILKSEVKKTRSLKTGGSLRPPPRPNSVEVSMLTTASMYSPPVTIQRHGNWHALIHFLLCNTLTTCMYALPLTMTCPLFSYSFVHQLF